MEARVKSRPQGKRIVAGFTATILLGGICSWLLATTGLCMGRKKDLFNQRARPMLRDQVVSRKRTCSAHEQFYQLTSFFISRLFHDYYPYSFLLRLDLSVSGYKECMVYSNELHIKKNYQLRYFRN
jgi:hypothetical protein